MHGRTHGRDAYWGRRNSKSKSITERFSTQTRHDLRISIKTCESPGDVGSQTEDGSYSPEQKQRSRHQDTSQGCRNDHGDCLTTASFSAEAVFDKTPTSVLEIGPYYKSHTLTLSFWLQPARVVMTDMVLGTGFVRALRGAKQKSLEGMEAAGCAHKCSRQY